jgi:Tol biopolymer transport system component
MSTRVQVLTALAVLGMLTAFSLSAQESADDMLQSALYKQEVEGDLEGAIELFSSIAEDYADDRAAAARALLQLGLAYETLGSREAEQAYRDLLRDYPEQSGAVDRARARLAILMPDSSADAPDLAARRIWQTPTEGVPSGAVAPDGSEIAFVQWGIEGRNTGDLGVVDLRTGNYRIVGPTSPFVATDTEDTYVLGSAWSRDGTQLAYSEYATSWEHHILYVVNADGTDRRIVTDNPQLRAIRPYTWSSDGKWIVALTMGWDEVRRIATISLEDGTVTVLKTLRRGISAELMTLSMSPDDRFIAYAYASAVEEEPDVHVLAVDGSSETVIAANVATDLYPMWTPEGSHLVFLSDRSGSADLWAVEMAEGQASNEARVVRTHVGPIVPLGFTADGALHYRVSLPTSDLRIVSLDTDEGFPGSGEQLSERYIGYNSRAEWSPDGTRIAFLSTRPGPGLEARNYLVVKSLTDGSERDIELSMYLMGESRPAWSADGRNVLLLAVHVEETPSGLMRRRAGYRIDVESGTVLREPYHRDYAGFWASSRARQVSERQSNHLRSLGIRIAGQRDLSTFTEDDEPLRDGEALLWVRNGMGWLRDVDCARSELFPDAACVESDVGQFLYEPVLEIPEGEYIRGWELSPDGDRVAYLLPDYENWRTRRTWNVWVRSVAMDDDPTLLYSHSDVGGCACVIRWSPDGRHLIYGFGATESDQMSQVYKLDADGGVPESLDWQVTRRQLGELAFDPSGKRAVLEAGPIGGMTEVWALSGFSWD